MLITLVGPNKCYKMSLPENAEGDYWLTDKSELEEKKLIYIHAVDGYWQIESSSYVQIFNPNCLINNDTGVSLLKTNYSNLDKIRLEPNKSYFVCLGKSKEILILNCFASYDINYIHYRIVNTQEVYIGNSIECEINYGHPFVSKKHARIFFMNNQCILENIDKKFGSVVNERAVYDKQVVLNNGDVIYIMGLKIIVLGKSLYINKPADPVIVSSKYFVIDNTSGYMKITNEEDDDFESIYNEDDYFFRAPRITEVIEKEKVTIDEPPSEEDKNEQPLILVIGPTLSMASMSFVSIFNTIQGAKTGRSSKTELVLSMIVAIMMMISTIVFPIASVKYEKVRKKKKERTRQERYKKYIEKKIDSMDKIMNTQRSILFQNYTPSEECARIIFEKDSRLWERKIDNKDFATVRLGIGDVESSIDITYPEEKFTMMDDNLLDIVELVGKKSKILPKAPITITPIEKKIMGIASTDMSIVGNYIENLIIQLIAFQSYEDLKIVFFVKDTTFYDWTKFKMLPHVWSNQMDLRYFATTRSEMQAVSKHLEDVFNERAVAVGDSDEPLIASPYYLIITDDYKNIESIGIIKDIVDNKINVGMGLWCIDNSIKKFPDECKTFLIIADRVGTIVESEVSFSKQRQFNFDVSQKYNFDLIAQKIANIPIKFSASSKEYLLPNSYTFMEMYNAGRIEQLNILNRWKTNDSTLSLSAPIGIEASGREIALDIHEKFHGPHGLIAGSTGSGKSEFIITYILSLAINYHPDDVTFILIDYKGGGLAGAFKKKDVVLPHLVGTITNIDKVGLQRSLDSIQSELRRRQVAFNDARNLTDESTIDIYKYQKLYHEGIVKKPIPHLLIICDEFAELKQQQEDFMDELISVARIGRSLGVHLILATQKPAGVVNDQIRSNSKFGVCLKVQEKEDSNDVIKKPDAAFLKKAGQFYLQVGNDEVFVLGQSGWAGAPYIESDELKPKVDTSIDFVSNIGSVIKNIDNYSQNTKESKTDQLTSIVRYIADLAEKNNIHEEPLWLENIPETIFLNEIKEKYNYKEEYQQINPVIGEYDDPFNQYQGVLTLDLTNNANTLIYGSADSGKETLVDTIIYDIIMTHSADEVNIFALDFGSEALRIFSKANQVGDVITASEAEKVYRYFDVLRRELRERKNTLAEYNGDMKLYLSDPNHKMPMILSIFNGFENFRESYLEDFEDDLQQLCREGSKYGLMFIFTLSSVSDIRYRLAQNFKQTICLQLNTDDEYMSVFDGIKKKRPSALFGRGLVRLNGEIYEFQTAKICAGDEWNATVRNNIEEANKRFPQKSISIPVMPGLITADLLKKYITDLSTLPIGVESKTLGVHRFNFLKYPFVPIGTKLLEESAGFVKELMKVLSYTKNAQAVLVDGEQFIQSNGKAEFARFQKILQTAKKDANIACVFYGLDRFLSTLEDPDGTMSEILSKAAELGNVAIIAIDTANKLKNHEYDSWYKAYSNEENGIWLGSGVNDQYLVNINLSLRERNNNCGLAFGYSANPKRAVEIKVVGLRNSEDGEE